MVQKVCFQARKHSECKKIGMTYFFVYFLIMTKIFVINNPDLPSIENVENVGARKSRHNVCEKNQVQDLNKHKEDASLETERNLHIGKSLKRQEKFELIIENGQTEY